MMVAGDLEGSGCEEAVLVEMGEDISCHHPVLSGQVSRCLAQDVTGEINRL